MKDAFKTFEEREKEIIKLIGINPLFSGLSQEDLKKLAKYVFKIEVRKGFPVFREGEIGDAMYFVVSGEIGVYKKTTQNESGGYGKKIAVIKAGQSFGEISLFESYTRTATAVAETDCVLLKLPRTELEKLEREEREIAYNILKKLAKILSVRLRKTTDMLADIVFIQSK